MIFDLFVYFWWNVVVDVKYKGRELLGIVVGVDFWWVEVNGFELGWGCFFLEVDFESVLNVVVFSSFVVSWFFFYENLFNWNILVGDWFYFVIGVFKFYGDIVEFDEDEVKLFIYL